MIFTRKQMCVHGSKRSDAGIESSVREYAGSGALTCRFGDPRKENCDMMCRPLRAVMVGHRYAIIVPEVHGIRCAPRSRRSHFAEIRHTCALFFFSFSFSLFSPARRRRTFTRRRENPLCRVSSHPGGVLLASTALPYARSRLAAQLHSNRSKSVAVRCRHMHSHCVTRGNK